MTSTTSKTIVGVFENSMTAERAVQDLVQSGFPRSDIQITTNDTFASDAARGNAGLTGMHPGEHTGGGVGGFFRNLFGIEDDEDRKYGEAIRRGATVVSVHAQNQNIDRALEIMDNHSPLDIDKNAGRSRSETYTGTGRDKTQSIPVVSEELQVDKRSVERGGVRVYSHTVEQPVETKVSLREEHVRVDRRAADRPATEADMHQDRVIEVRETVEEPVITKRARVKEEVVIEKDARMRTETIRDTVRRTDVNVEPLDKGRAMNAFEEDFRSDFSTRYGSMQGAAYETYAPAYRYGYSSGTDDRYRGRNWDDIEQTLKTDYLRNNPNSKWDQMKGAVRYGWEKVSGQRS